MKKIIYLFIVLAIVLSTTVGCTIEGLPKGMSGTNAAKIMLAKERLNSSVLKRKGSIFDSGVEDLNNLAYLAESNLKEMFSGSGQYIMPDSIDDSMQDVLSFDEISNSYGYFENRTTIIVQMANSGADLIDYVKKNIRILDTWIAKGDTEYYLSVDSESETLYSRTDFQVDMCKRYTNENGKNVYEIWIDNEIATNRCLYIPGERYEMIEFFKNDSDNLLVFAADHTKGYWQTFVASEYDSRFNVNLLAMPSALTCDILYNVDEKSVHSYQVISADRKTDIFSIDYIKDSLSSVTIKLNGFEGVKSVGSNGSINFTNGISLNPSQEVNSNVTYTTTIVSDTAYGTEAELMITVSSAETDPSRIIEDKLNIIKDFVKYTGLQCKRDLNAIMKQMTQVISLGEQFKNHYLFNGYTVTSSGLKSAFNVEKSKLNALSSKYGNIKSKEVIDYDRRENLDFLINFAPISATTFNDVNYANGSVTVGNISLTVTDTTLYVVDEPYIVNFALEVIGSGTTASLIPVELNSTAAVTYQGADTFTVSTSDIFFLLPAVATGSFRLVAYISTSDGIKASDVVPVTFTNVTANTIRTENLTITISESNGVLNVVSEETQTIYHELAYSADMTYSAFADQLAKIAFVYGLPDESIEILDEETGTYSAVPSNTTSILSGTYRIEYTYNEGNSADYVYVVYN
ncbi:MAG: hypothetical protein E7315_05905 [Clostridiales bacterium]|nr:hypothetical protein [Clostridiales bacterium]